MDGVSATLTTSRIVARFALLAIGAAVTVAILFLLPRLFLGGFDAILKAEFFRHSWQLAELDQQGRIIKLGSSTLSQFLSAWLAVLALLSIEFAAINRWLGFTRTVQAGPAATAANLESSSRQLEGEISAILTLLGAQQNANERFASALDDAGVKLTPRISSEQLKSVIELLVRENSRATFELKSLRKGLENSRSQVLSLQQSLREAEETGLSDALTSLKNRRWLELNLERMLRDGEASERPLCLIMADIDHFKKINDQFGHPVGDAVLKKFSEILSAEVKSPDVAIRYGGEEFMVVMPGAEIRQATSLADRLRRELQQKSWLEPATGQALGTVTASFGIAQSRRSDGAGDLIRRADAKLYDAKKNGRNRVVSENVPAAL